MTEIKTVTKSLHIQEYENYQLFVLSSFLSEQHDQYNTAIFNRSKARPVPYLSCCGELNYRADRLVRHRK